MNEFLNTFWMTVLCRCMACGWKWATRVPADGKGRHELECPLCLRVAGVVTDEKDLSATEESATELVTADARG